MRGGCLAAWVRAGRIVLEVHPRADREGGEVDDDAHSPPGQEQQGGESEGGREVARVTHDLGEVEEVSGGGAEGERVVEGEGEEAGGVGVDEAEEVLAAVDVEVGVHLRGRGE